MKSAIEKPESIEPVAMPQQKKQQYTIEFLKKFKSCGKYDEAIQNIINKHFEQEILLTSVSGDVDDSANAGA